MTTNKTAKFRTKLTPKQKKFAINYVKNNGNGTQAIKDSEYNVTTDKSAQVMATENLSKPLIKSEIVKLMDKNGLTDDKLLEVHKDGLKAINQDGSKDFSVRHRYLDTAYKLKGYTNNDTQSGNNQLLQINFDTSFFKKDNNK